MIMGSSPHNGPSGLLVLLVLLWVEPCLSFLPITPEWQSHHAACLTDARSFHCPLVSPFPMTISPAECSDNGEGDDGVATTSEEPTLSLLEAKLVVLQDVVLRLGQRRRDDRLQIETLRSQVVQLEAGRQQEEERCGQALRAAATAEAREQALRVKVDDLEERYHREAAQYQVELGVLQREWKRENRRLEKELRRLSAELTEAKTVRNQETALLLDQLGRQNEKLEQELKLAREQIQFLNNWQLWQKKQRSGRLYDQALRLWQRETKPRDGFWKRVFKTVFGRGPTSSKPVT